MSDRVDLEAVSRTVEALLAQAGQPVLLHDQVKNTTVTVAPDTAAAPDGLLPVLLVAAEVIWRDISGKGFELDLRTDPNSLLGYRVHGIGTDAFPLILLAVMEARAQATRQGAFLVNQLGAIWRDAADGVVPSRPTGLPGPPGAVP